MKKTTKAMIDTKKLPQLAVDQRCPIQQTRAKKTNLLVVVCITIVAKQLNIKVEECTKLLNMAESGCSGECLNIKDGGDMFR